MDYLIDLTKAAPRRAVGVVATQRKVATTVGEGYLAHCDGKHSARHDLEPTGLFFGAGRVPVQFPSFQLFRAPRRPATDAELRARSIVEGDRTETARLESQIDHVHRSEVLPVLFVLRAMFHETGPQRSIGALAARGVEAQLASAGPDAALVGGLLALVVLHDATALPRLVSRLCSDRALASTVLEALLALRFVALGARVR